MAILITGGNSRLARTLARGLVGERPVRLADQVFTAPVDTPIEHVVTDLRDPEQMTGALDGVDCVIHAAPYLPGRETGPDAVEALDVASRGSFVLFNAARSRGVERFILLSTLKLFDPLPAHWHVDEGWRPRPSPELDQLCPWLAELSVRENSRVGAVQSICLRLGCVVDDAQAQAQPFDPLWVHIDDVVHGVRRALSYSAGRRPDWSVFHLMAPGRQAKIRLAHAASARSSFGYQPVHEFTAHRQVVPAPRPVEPELPWRELLKVEQIPSRPIHRVLILGAGGPMGAVAAQELRCSYTLRLTDVRPIGELAVEAKPQAPGAPLPVPLGSPHEDWAVDVRHPAQVTAAAEGMDAVINLTVVRTDPANAFLVNTVGAYSAMRAAVAQKIRRVVQTGPLVQHLAGWGDYTWDYDVPVDAPGRPYDQLYIHSKYLGQEICRVFAETYGLEVPVLLFMALYNPDLPVESHPFMVSWQDAARAVRRALEVSSLPSPFEMINISVDLPHGHYDHRKTQQVLDWTARDALRNFWQDLPTARDILEPSPSIQRTADPEEGS